MKYILLFLLFISTFASAQTNFKFNQFTIDDGLPCNTIYSITEDKNGNIVLGTDNGLSVFDGTKFTNYNVKDGLINPYIVGVSNDNFGNILLINYNAKLQKLIGNKIVNINIETSIYNTILSFGKALFLTNSQTRNIDKRYVFKEIKNYNKIISNTRIAPPILFQDNQEIKIIENRIIYKNFKILLPKKVKFIHQIIFRKNDVCILDDDFLFISNFSGTVLQQIKLPNNLSENSIYKHDFIVDHLENCWLNIQNKGLFVLENTAWKSVNNQMNLTAKDNINFLFCDNKGKIWIATHDNGLFCISTTLIKTIFCENENYFTGFANSFNKKTLLVSSPFSLYQYKNNRLQLLENFDSEIKLSNFNYYPVISNSKFPKNEFVSTKNM